MLLPKHSLHLLCLWIFCSSSPLGHSSPGTPDLPPLETVKTPTPAYARYLQVAADTYRLRNAQDMDGLEALADQLRQSRESTDTGDWLLSTFYSAAGVIPRDEEGAKAAMEFYERWARERPRSMTAQVCLAKALVRYAWVARGDGWADSVTKEGWRLFKERLARAWDVLDHARQLDGLSPGWYDAALGVALGQGWDHQRYLQTATEAIRLAPTYGRYYSQVCYWLLPRWYGKKGEYERWIASQAESYPPDERDRQYAYLVLMAENMPEGEFIFGPGHLDWERTKHGFELWLKEKPENLMLRFCYTRLAVLADDRGTARAQFEITGGKYFPGTWGKPEIFEQARQFAFSGGKNPLLKAPDQESEEKVHPRFSPQVIQWTTLACRLFSGLMGGLLAGICLLILAVQRKQVWAGVIALLACLILATPFGTITTLLPGAGLWLYLRRRPRDYPEIAPSSGWIVLLWMILLVVLYVGLQFGAAIPAAIPLILKNGANSSKEGVRALASDGTMFVIFLNGAWITFLTLLAICRPRTREGWRRILGLYPFRPLQTLPWILLALFIVVGLGFAMEHFHDERSRAALKLMALGFHSPVVFFLSLCLAAPVVEEIIFRGYLYSGWILKLGFWGTALSTSAAFAVCHLQYGLAGIFQVFVMGLLFSALRWKTGSIYPGMILHSFWNFIFACWLYYVPLAI